MTTQSVRSPGGGTGPDCVPSKSEAAAKRSSNSYYRPELDVVRFLAFLLVFLYHTLPSGDDPRIVHLFKGLTPIYSAFSQACGFGLTLFFTLSAFLICELLMRERRASGTVAVKKFYTRRILRIWPLYYFGLLLGVAASFLPGVDPSSGLKMGWFAIFMGAWVNAARGPVRNPANVLWSISVEEQFYLFAPWMMKYGSRRTLFGCCFALILFSNSWLLYLGEVKAPYYAIWFNSFVQFECFAAGILLCLVLKGGLPRFVAWQRILLLLFGLSCWFCACYPPAKDEGPNPGSWALIEHYGLAALGAAVVLAAFLGIRSSLLPRWAIFLGRISFGLYVFHEFAVDLTSALILNRLAMAKSNWFIRSLEGPIYLLNMALALGLTIAMAAVSYRYLETPFLKLKSRLAVIASEPVGMASKG